MGEQVAFATEVVVDAFLVDPGHSRDPLDGGAVQPVGGEFGDSRVEDAAFRRFCVPGHGSFPLAVSFQREGWSFGTTVLRSNPT